MTTRDENLKKINDELEKMSDEELDNVAGGTCGQTEDDSKLLYKHGLMDTWYGAFGLLFSWNSKSSKVDAGWAKAGITCVTNWIEDNKYFVGGKEITKDEAYKIVQEKFKKIRDV